MFSAVALFVRSSTPRHCRLYPTVDPGHITALLPEALRYRLRHPVSHAVDRLPARSSAL
jgi:hypothetical protein